MLRHNTVHGKLFTRRLFIRIYVSGTSVSLSAKGHTVIIITVEPQNKDNIEITSLQRTL